MDSLRPTLTTAFEGLRLAVRRPFSTLAWATLLGLSLIGSTLAGVSMMTAWWENHVAVLGDLTVMSALGAPVLATGLALLIGAIYRATLKPGSPGFAFLRIGGPELALWPWAAGMAVLFFVLAWMPPKGPAHYLLLAGATLLATPFTYVGPAIFRDGWKSVGGSIRLAFRDGLGLALMNLIVLAIYVGVRWPTSRIWADYSRSTRDPATGVPENGLLNVFWLGLATLVAFTLWLVLSAASAARAYDVASRDSRSRSGVFD